MATKKFEAARKFGLLAGAAFAAFAGAAWAQTPPAPTPSPEEREAQNEEAADQTVVVTGSRIRQNEFTSSSPIQVITRERATAEGLATSAQILQGASAAAGSTQINQLFRGFLVDGGPGVNTVSLRGLGAQRSLFLLNGRRVGVSGVTGTTGPFDANVLPDNIIDRFEVLLDGASSVYGSDAVAGVVNVVTDKGLDGLNLDVSANVPQEDGGQDYSASVAYGKTFSRGQVLASFEYSRQEALRLGQRDFTSCVEDYLFTEDQTQRIDRIDPRTGKPFCLNILSNVVQLFRGSANPATATPIIPGSTEAAVPVTGIAGITNWNIVPAFQSFRLNQNDPSYANLTVLPEQDDYSFFGTFSYDLGILGNAEAFGELLYTKRETQLTGLRQIFPFVSAANPMVPAIYRSTPFNNIIVSPVGIVPNPNPAQTLATTQVRPIFTVPSSDGVELDYFNAVLGVRGDITSSFLNGWAWELYMSGSRSEGSYENQAIPQDRVDALSQMTLVNGVLTCPATTVLATNGRVVPTPAGCPSGINIVTDANILAGNLPQNLRDWLILPQVGNTTYERTLINGSITGDVMELPAGPVATALGFEFRRDLLDDIPGPFAIVGNEWGRTTAGRTKGNDSVVEVFGELQVPILANVPLFEKLQFNGSMRWFDYKSYGSNDVYKAGLDWRINPEWRVKLNYGTAYRTPALYELYLANQLGFTGGGADPCITTGVRQTNPLVNRNCLADGIPETYAGQTSSIPVRRGGGVGSLRDESSTSETIGIVWTPSFTDLSIGLDYFEIQIDDQVSTAGAAAILFQCYNSPNFDPSSGFCAQFTRQRDAASPQFLNITNVDNGFRNLNSQRTRGIDLTLQYERDFDFGTVNLFSQNSWTFEDEVEAFDGVLNEFNGELGDPDFVGTAQLQFERKDWSLTWTARYLGKSSDAEDLGGRVFTGFTRYEPLVGFRPLGPSTFSGVTTRPNVYVKTEAELLVLHTLSGRYAGDDWSVTAGVANLFNEEPAAVSNGIGAIRFGRSNLLATPLDAFRGRTFFMNVSKSF